MMGRQIENGTNRQDRPCPLRVVMAGGGTGGHLFPAIAMAQELRRREPEASILFVGSGRPFEHDTLARYQFALEVIPSAGIKGQTFRARLQALGKALAGVAKAWNIIRRFKPHLVVSVGSYVAGPMALAGWLMRVPLVLQEQNSVPGITHRLLAPLARRIYVTFEISRRWFPAAKVRLMGNPLRRELLAERGARDKSDATTDSALSPFTVLIIGGSQGARAINQSVVAALEHDGAAIYWIHQTGIADEEWVRSAYANLGIDGEIRAFFIDLERAYHQADLVVCRSGATTLTELAALGKPAIFIPFPHAADNHQEHNAREMSATGAAETILENELTGHKLAARIHHYRRNRQELVEMGHQAARFGRPQAARDIVDDWDHLLQRSPMAA